MVAMCKTSKSVSSAIIDKGTSSQVPTGGVLGRVGGILRAGGLGLLVRRGHQVVLRKIHELVIEPMLSRGELHDTSGTVSLNELTIESPNKHSGLFYDPTPRLVIRWVLDALPFEKSAWNFVDIGTGRGRVILEAARHPFRRVIGVEFARELVQQAEDNVASLPLGHIFAGRLGVVHADATEWTPPSGPTVFFLFNPFDGRMMKRFLQHVLDDKIRAGRPMVFIYVNPEQEHVFQQDHRVDSVRVPEGLSMRAGMLSPYRVSIFETNGATSGF